MDENALNYNPDATVNYDDLDARQQYVPSQSRVLKQISKHCGIVMRDEIHQEFRAKIENDKQI